MYCTMNPCSKSEVFLMRKHDLMRNLLPCHICLSKHGDKTPKNAENHKAYQLVNTNMLMSMIQ